MHSFDYSCVELKTHKWRGNIHLAVNVSELLPFPVLEFETLYLIT